MLKNVCSENGLDYKEWIEGLKHKEQWRVEVY